MLQGAVIGVSVALILVGIKGFTRTGLPLTKGTNLTGTRAKVVGALCVVAGLSFIPLFALIVRAFH